MTDPYNSLGAMDPNRCEPPAKRQPLYGEPGWEPQESRLYNAVRCRGCGTVVQSHHRHDFVNHDCPVDPRIEFFVDGGWDYLRRGWTTMDGHYQKPEQHFDEWSRTLWPCSIPPGYGRTWT
jgi:hypothetical protein